MTTHVRFCFVALAICLLAGCGGSSLDSDTDAPLPPILINAGANQTVNENVSLTLTGSASGDNTPFTYTWQSVPALTLTQTDASSPEVNLVTPSTTESLTFTLSLTVTDSTGNQVTDSLELTVLPVNELPTAVIDVSQPSSGADALPAGIGVVLSGSNSADFDAAAGTDPIASWRWQQTAGQDVVSGISLDGDSLAFTTPVLDDNSSLTFSLTVTDQEGGQDTREITLSVLSASNTLPTVDAGLDHQVFGGESILLTGVASTSVAAAEPLSFQWLNDSALTPAINDEAGLQTFAVAPVVDTEQLVTFTLQVTDAFNNRVEDEVTVRIRPLPLHPVNDTGVILQANATQVSTQHQSDFPGQDGQRGQDIIHFNNLLEKAGRGDNGFDFSRLDAVGDEVDDPTAAFSCVRDNVTGLVWEVKTNDNGLHDGDFTYSWFFTSNNGGIDGDNTSIGATCSIASCNTTAFIEAVNAQGMCNFFDWRLPTHNELLSIVHYGNTASPLIDLDNFPNTDTGSNDPLWYWTRNVSVDGASEDGAPTAWTIDFASGNDNFLNKSTLVHIRLVRGGR